MELFWERSGWEAEDKHLRALELMPFRRAFPRVKLASGLQSIRGPRQIGKSSLLKTLLSQATRGGKKCFFFSCEEVETFKELSEILKPLRRLDVILLDEISFVKSWDRAVKHFIDSGFDGALIITGSNTIDLKEGLDRMPGRWVSGTSEHELLPMAFAEWLDMRMQAGWSKHFSIKENWENYFKIGGFPTALLEAGEDCKEPVQAKQTYLRWLIGDLKKKNRQEIYLKELLGQLAVTLTTPISLQKLAQKTQMMSYHTAQDYIELLERCYALRTLFCVDPDTFAYRFKKEKKFYFTDPLIYWIALDWSGYPVDAQSIERIAEQVAHEFLARQNRRIGFLSSPLGEIDFLVLGKSLNEKSAIEVKWAPVPKNLSKAYFNFPITRKKVWCQQNFLE